MATKSFKKTNQMKANPNTPLLKKTLVRAHLSKVYKEFIAKTAPKRKPPPRRQSMRFNSSKLLKPGSRNNRKSNRMPPRKKK